MSRLLPILVRETGLTEHDLMRIVATAPSRYKVFPIPKRDGEDRWIAQPAREVKLLQRTLIQHLLADLPVHPAATAYREGKSIRDNAAPHAGGGPIRKYDFSQFFSSIRARDWERYCRSNEVLTDVQDVWLTTRIFFHREKGASILKLAIGAPSSPMLSNVLMFRFDELISAAVATDKVIYTRYADDLTFSAPRTGHLNHVEPALRGAIKSSGIDHLELNERKTVVATRKYRRQVTGLVLTNDGEVSIGRDRKRLIRAALHRESLGLLTPQERAKLCGILAFVNSVEPRHLAKLREKFGDQLIERLKSDATTSRRVQKG